MARHIGERKTNLAFCFQEILTATVRLRFNKQSAPKPEIFRAHMREAYRLATLEAQSSEYQSDYINIAGHAVIAFLDETVALSQNTAFSGWWISPARTRTLRRRAEFSGINRRRSGCSLREICHA